MIPRLLLLLLLAVPAYGANFYIDRTNGVDDSDCGAATGTDACRTWLQFLARGFNPGSADIVHVAAATIPERMSIPWHGNASAPVTIQCDSPTNCILTSTGSATYTGMSQCGFITIGSSSVSTSNCGGADIVASYVKITGFKVQNVIQGGTNGFAGLLVNRAGSHHLSIRDNIFDGTGATDNTGYAQVAIGGGGAFKSFINNQSINCKGTNGNGGCFAIDQASNNFAAIGNTFGPHNTWPTTLNSDGLLTQNLKTALLDGNIVTKAGDGIDIGMTNATPMLDHIIRFNDISGARGTGVGRSIKVSGSVDFTVSSQGHAIYKNVIHPADTNASGSFHFEELSINSDAWFNTIFNPVGSNSSSYWIVELGSPTNRASLHHIGTRYNIFASDAAGGAPGPVRLDDPGGTSTPTNGCASQSCPFTSNEFDYPGGGTCLEWDPSDATGHQYACSTGGLGTLGTPESGSFNTDFSEATSNFFQGAAFLNRSAPTVLSNLKLTAPSPGLNKGDTFCHASSAGSGNTISVTCTSQTDGTGTYVATDPRRWFPLPANFYDVLNADCVSKGARAQDAMGTCGCFDLMIEGCAGTGGACTATGVRTLTDMTATTITFSGSSCTWANGAKVGIPWEGSAPDLGGLEFNSGAATTSTTTTATTSTSTVTGSTTTTLAVFTTYG